MRESCGGRSAAPSAYKVSRILIVQLKPAPVQVCYTYATSIAEVSPGPFGVHLVHLTTTSGVSLSTSLTLRVRRRNLRLILNTRAPKLSVSSTLLLRLERGLCTRHSLLVEAAAAAAESDSCEAAVSQSTGLDLLLSVLEHNINLQRALLFKR